MTNETQIKAISGIFEALLVNDPDHFLVDVQVKPTNNFKIFVDGDKGVTIATCVSLNRAAYKQLEESNMFPDGDFSLEVSSPGLEEPLKLLRQYKNNIGRFVEIMLKDGTRIEGKMVVVNDADIIVEETKGKNKKKEIIQHTFLFDHIKTTKIQVVF